MTQDAKSILTRHLELDAFYTGDFAVRGKKRAAAEPAPIEEKPMVKKAAKIESFSTLEVIAAAVRTCRKCVLGSTRINAVPGQGDPKARLMFIGEGPGADEDAQGLAFVGRAG